MAGGAWKYIGILEAEGCRHDRLMGIERGRDQMGPVLPHKGMIDAEGFGPEGARNMDFETRRFLSINVADQIVTPVEVRKSQRRVPRRAVRPKINIYMLANEVLGERGTAQVGQASLGFALGINQQRKTRTSTAKILKVNRGR